MSAESIAFAKEVAALSPALSVLFEDHVKDNFGEILPHVYFGDVTRHVLALAHQFSSEEGVAARREAAMIFDAMEAGYSTEIPAIQELIAASFLENLPREDEVGSEIRGMAGLNLGRQLKNMM